MSFSFQQDNMKGKILFFSNTCFTSLYIMSSCFDIFYINGYNFIPTLELLNYTNVYTKRKMQQKCSYNCIYSRCDVLHIYDPQPLVGLTCRNIHVSLLFNELITKKCNIIQLRRVLN